ncbi:MAG: UDP-3-O-acyl-N-acetylglucosamine deacetylase [Fimbriimonadaceae bacterium]
MKIFPRQTLRESVTLEGPGLHSGGPVSVTIHPARDGIHFRLGSERIEAHVRNVTDTSRCTMLGSISTVEHVLSALAGLAITDAEIEVSGGELPAADGCSQPYVEAFESVGYESCGTLEIEGPFARVYAVEGQAKFAVAAGEGWWRAEFELEDCFIGRQEVEMSWTPTRYAADVAPARTVVLEWEMEMVKQYGLGKGLDESSCLGIGREQYMNPARFSDEPVRHKLLDLIGDLSLAGVPVEALDVVGERCGHAVNILAAQRLAERVTIRRVD